IRKAMGPAPYKDAIEMEKAMREAENQFRDRSAKGLPAKPAETTPVVAPAESEEAVDQEELFTPGVRWKLQISGELEDLRQTGTEPAPKIHIPAQWDDFEAAKSIVREIDPKLRFINIAGRGTTGLIYLVEKEGKPFALKIPVPAEYWSEAPVNSDAQHN